jgi:hypothetical protein
LNKECAQSAHVVADEDQPTWLRWLLRVLYGILAVFVGACLAAGACSIGFFLVLWWVTT